jgi:predicted Zn-dependent peptidase
MLIIDDLLTFPLRGILWIFKEVQHAAQEEQATAAANITAELSELYMRLETGEISEAEFEAREKALLDRLESLQEPPESLD